MRNRLRYIEIMILAFVAFAMPSCIVNDIPYPYLPGEILSFEVVGQKDTPKIDLEKRVVSLELADTVDIENVTLVKFEVTEQATVEPEVSNKISLKDSLIYTLRTYPGQEYRWIVKGKQNISRYITAEKQVGKTEIDPHGLVAAFYVTDNIKDVVIKDIMLGPSNSTITPDPREIRDFSSPVKVTVSYRDVVEVWTIYVFIKVPEVVSESVDAWSTHAYLNGTFAQGMENPTFKIKKDGDADWNEIPSGSVSITGTSYTALASGLVPGAKYICKAVAGGSEGEEISFETEASAQLPNMNFDEWYQGGQAWFPAADAASLFWDSANGGTADFGYVPTVPEETVVKSGKAAKLSTIEANVVVLTKLAAGNLYTGQFGEVVMSGGGGAILEFGRPFASRPTSMKGWVDYRPANVSTYCDPKYADMKDKPDHGQVYVILADWGAPKKIDTTKGNFIDVNNDEGIIGYGEMTYTANTNGYVEFNIPIEYRNHRKPKYVVVVCSASKYGDYFTGGVGSVMYVDEFVFKYNSEVKWK